MTTWCRIIRGFNNLWYGSNLPLLATSGYCRIQRRSSRCATQTVNPPPAQRSALSKSTAVCSDADCEVVDDPTVTVQHSTADLFIYVVSSLFAPVCSSFFPMKYKKNELVASACTATTHWLCYGNQSQLFLSRFILFMRYQSVRAASSS